MSRMRTRWGMCGLWLHEGGNMSDETNPGPAQQPRICQVIADYQAFYPDPISVNAGESFDISEKVDYWDGNPNWTWIWCTDQRGKSGWVPKEWIDFSANG